MRVWAALSLLFTALLLGTTFAHLLEIGAKREMDGALWTTLQQRLYRSFATVGGAVEISSIISTAALVWSVQGTGRWLACGALGCMVVAFAGVWVGVVQPVNQQVARWQPSTIPPGWQRLRRRWDLGHGIRFGLHLLGFVLLVALIVFGRRP